jgi:outer membrane lipoprotein-sorting protein
VTARSDACNGAFAAACALATLMLGPALLGAAPSGPAAAFLETWAKIPSYTCSIKVHETKGSDVQDRTYNYAYLKPHFAKIDITGGPGRGGGASWQGGDTVSGHQGGILSGIHLTVSIHDGRAVDLRGGTVAQASFQDIADELKDASSEQTAQEQYNGSTMDVVTFPYTDANGATKRAVYLSPNTHLPVRRVTWAGTAVVEDEQFSNVLPNVNLKESDF